MLPCQNFEVDHVIRPRMSELKATREPQPEVPENKDQGSSRDSRDTPGRGRVRDERETKGDK